MLVFLLDLILSGFHLFLHGVPGSLVHTNNLPGVTGAWQRALLAATLCFLAGWRFLFLLDWTYRITFESYALLKKEPSLQQRKAGLGA